MHDFVKHAQTIDQRFTSGNGIAVERVTVKRGEWESIKAELARLQSALHQMPTDKAQVNPERTHGAVDVLPPPSSGSRVETGVVQFGDDWPGVFLRGDNAAYFGMALEQLLNGATDPITRNTLSGLCDLLKSSQQR